MAQSTINSRQAATYVGLETTFASTPGTVYRAFPKSTPDIGLEQAEVENDNESVYLFDYLDPVQGIKDGSVKAEFYLRPHASQLNSSTAPSNNYLQQVLKGTFGGHTVNTGSLVGASATTGSIPVDTSSRFSVGQWALFTTTAGLEPARITAISASTLTVFPALSSAPSSGSAAINMDNFYPTENNTNSLTVQHAKAEDSAFQVLMNGCIGGAEIKLERGALATVSVDLKAATWSTGSLGYSTAVGTDTLASPMVVKDAVVLVQPTTTSTRTQYPLKSLSLKLDLGNSFLEELGGAEGKTGPVRTGNRSVADITLRFKADTVAEGYWSNQTKLSVMAMVPVGSSTSKRWIVLDVPTAVPVGRPKLVDDGGVLYLEMTLKAKLSTVNSSQSTDLARAPVVLAVG